MTAKADQANFNEVGKQMVGMLQNSHFARLPFNEELSERFLEDYLTDLDSQRLYFTQEDVERFEEEYGDRLHRILLDAESMPVAIEIYSVFRDRVRQRVAQANELLEKDEFDFTKEESVMMSRKEAEWPANEAEAARLFSLQIKEAVLSEILRREMVSRLAKEQGKVDPGEDQRGPLEKVKLRYKRFLASVEDADDEDVASYFLSAVARAYDPHTDYMSFREMNRFRDGMKNQLVGVGALLQAEEDGATIIKGIVVGGPADRQGSLKLNDRVVAVDSLNTGKPEDMVDIMFMKIDKVVDLIRGKEGTEVALKVEPAGGAPGETRIIVIKRGKVEMKDEQASAEIIDIREGKDVTRRIGVLTLPSFYADFEQGKVSSANDVELLLERLNEEEIDGLILDLRGNGGGSLEEVRRMTGFFTERGPVVQVKNTLGQVQVKQSDNGGPLYDGPMVVMIDRASASASEILAGALQDANRAVVVGESATFGKGTVQQPMDIGRMLPLFAAKDRAGYLKVTIQKFYRPSGSSTQLEGVQSDIALPSISDALEIGEKYLDHALRHDRIRKAPGFNPSPRQALFVPRLKELSMERVSESKDFEYTIEDVMRTKQRMERNRLSLNKEEREQELRKSDMLEKQRNKERRKRFAEMNEQDRKKMDFYRLTLDDLKEDVPLVEYDPSEGQDGYMRRAVDETAELDTTPEWPSGLNPTKRESLHILMDLVELTENARMAGLIK
ncbi:MAG: carboxy terminal-processing peptidase [Akkermansiaceae bacterium]|nr:carboxy terminal-processing peptidase [Akkermansiaceae bacterium]